MKIRSFKNEKIFSGRVTVPGDKSISHRALILASLSIGVTHVFGLLESGDVAATCRALMRMGVKIVKKGSGHWSIIGVGLGGLCQPDDIVCVGNSGTSARLLMGVVGSHPLSVVFSGDASMRRRPMGRVVEPLQRMGVCFTQGNNGDFLPLTVVGTEDVLPLSHSMAVPSAQVKSAILLAGLRSRGNTVVVETIDTRNHTENLLRHFGASLDVRKISEQTHITLPGGQTLVSKDVIVPGDPSSAAFLVACACIAKGSHVVLSGVCINPGRIGFFITLQEMGAHIVFENIRFASGEKVADIVVKYKQLRGVTIPAGRSVSMIDEYPILAIVAAFSVGVTKMSGLKELRVKESDRLRAIQSGLRANGVTVEASQDSLTIVGRPSVRGGGHIKTHLDHRIAMSFLCMGLATSAPITIDDGRCIETSFPSFLSLMTRLGANITECA